MANYRDYVAIGRNPQSINVPVSSPKGQVYQATHRGENRLSPMYRSFISFSFGGKHIEDFNLIVTIDNNRWERSGYAEFDSVVTSYDALEGQQLWGTHYRTNEITFNLSTDGIDQKMLDEFLYWFRAGEVRELILAEHPNRAQLARVSEPPQLSLLPFEGKAIQKISNQEYEVTTTLYKGEIELTFIMDSPHWYAKQNVLGHKIYDSTLGSYRFIDEWLADEDTDTWVNIFASQDALKILYEDGIPLGSMIGSNMLLGNGATANVEDKDYSMTWNKAENSIVWTDGVPDGKGARIDGTLTAADIADFATDGITNRANIDWIPGTYKGCIAGAIIDADGNGIESLSANTKAYFFYAGTAPAPVLLEFTMKPRLYLGTASASKYLITRPGNSFVTKKYNTFTIGSETTQEFKITTPNLYTSYNTAIEILRANNGNSFTSWPQIAERIRDEVRHPAVRAWAMKVLEYGELKNNHSMDTLGVCMSYMLREQTGEFEAFTADYSFNSETGEAVGVFSYREPTSSALSNDMTLENWQTYGNVLENKEEDVGDMLVSNYIILVDRNYPTSEGRIVAYDSSQAGGKLWSHYIQHDIDLVEITNLKIVYKNMYL